MRCEQITPYLPGYAGGDLRPDTIRIVGEHLGGCATCRAEAARHDRVHVALASMSEREVEPPALLAEAILATVGERGAKRLLPVDPASLPGDVVRLLQENRETIASAGAAAVVAAGAAYALWRAVRKPRPRAHPATS